MLGLGTAGCDDDDDDTLVRARWLRTILGSPLCMPQAASLAMKWPGSKWLAPITHYSGRNKELRDM